MNSRKVRLSNFSFASHRAFPCSIIDLGFEIRGSQDDKVNKSDLYHVRPIIPE